MTSQTPKTMTFRDSAISAARDLAQQIWAEGFQLGNHRYYVEHDGSITRDEFVGNFYERQSVYFGEVGHAERLCDTGLGSVGYNGSETDYRNLQEPDAEATKLLPPGKYVEDYIARHDMPEVLAARFDEGLYWDGAGWCRLEDSPCHWSDRNGDDPSLDLIAKIEALPIGWFGDETTDCADGVAVYK